MRIAAIKPKAKLGAGPAGVGAVLGTVPACVAAPACAAVLACVTAAACAATPAFAEARAAPGASAAGSSDPKRASLGAPYGLVASSANGLRGDSVRERTEAYERLRRAGVRAIRLDINWDDVEPAGEPLGDYDFSRPDREVRAIRRAGLRVIGLLAYGHPDYSSAGGVVDQTPAAGGLPPFGIGNAHYFPPDEPPGFARYARAVARHYGDEVIAWEIWNEQNEGWRFWPPREDPPAYADLLCATYPKLKRVDPDIPVLYGGVFFPAVADQPGMSGPSFVEATYDARPDLAGCFDALAYHPYAYPFTAPELDVPIRGSVLSAADQMRAVLERNGDGGKPLWITEVGWPTNDRAYGVSEQKQAQYVARMQAATFAQGLPVLTWYTYGDGDDPSGANQEAAFGFFRADGSPKPSYRALKTFARVFRGARFRRDLSRRLGMPEGETLLGGRGFALRYRRPARRRGRSARTTPITRCPAARITAIWLAGESVAEAQGPLPEGGTAGPRSMTVSVPVRRREVELVGHLGEREVVTSRGRRVEVEAGPAPVYVVDGARSCAT